MSVFFVRNYLCPEPANCLMQAENIGQDEVSQTGQLLWKKVNQQMKKNDLIKTEDGIYRILSIEANRVLAIDCIKKTMPKFYSVSSFGNGENIDCIPVDFLDIEDLSPADRKIAQERYTMIASAVSVVDDTKQRNLMIEKSSKQFGMSKQSIRSFLCSYLVYGCI